MKHKVVGTTAWCRSGVPARRVNQGTASGGWQRFGVPGKGQAG
ncbi:MULTISPECIES: hypothetical protein [Kribbella]